MPSPETTAIAGPWITESGVSDDTEERGLAVIAALPELARIPGATPTRGMVAWVHSGLGACETDEQAVATARLIAAAPDLFSALSDILVTFHARPDIMRLCGVHENSQLQAACDALNKAVGREALNVR